ncbi:hypothetical protein FCM35_KLT20758 [Carex littledalei]|uniref:BPS1-like protein n=1 Tax=Carex littledalei TaxID=544730 RepID=A0A833VUP4_9POAL|nr:hypothetical protein FCM35_KLT20758 [Carex littledalei]
MRGSLLSCVKPQSRYTADLKEDASMFLSSLTDGLARLDESLTKESVSLKWSIEAMNLLKNMQTDLLALFKKFNLPISIGSDEDWFDQYMQETAILLDFCNTLKAAISRFNWYCMIVDLTIKMLAEDNPSKIVDFDKMEFNRMEKSREWRFDMKLVNETVKVGYKTYSGNQKCDKEMMLIMLVTKTTMLVLSLILVSSMTSPVSVDTNGAEPGSRVQEVKPCFDLLSQIARKVGERFENAEITIVEHEMIVEVLRDLKGQLVGGVAKDRVKFLKDLEKLREKLNGLKEGVERFNSVLHEVFDEVIKGRNEMLGIFRDSLDTR